MRIRTLLAGGLLTLLAAAWTAPAALAAETNEGSDPNPRSSSSQRLAVSTDDQNSGSGNGGGTKEQSPQPSSEPPKPINPPKQADPPKPVEQPKPANPVDPAKPVDPVKPPTQPVPPPPPPVGPKPPVEVQKPIPADPVAHLSLAPNTVKAGETMHANASCDNGTRDTLTGDAVSFSGLEGTVSQGASEGNHTVTLVCVNATKRNTATATFQVVKRNDPGGPGLHPSLMVSPKEVKPGDEIQFNGGCPNGRQQTLTADGVDIHGNSGTVRRDAREGGHTATRVCVEGNRTESATDTFRVVTGGEPGGDTLSVSPKVVRQGDTIYFNGGCRDGREQLDADGVDVRGRIGRVHDDARLGDHTARRTCFHGNGVESVSDTFRVIPGDGGGPGDGPRDFWLSDRSGYRGDSVDVSVRCRDNWARLESDALEDTTLRRDGSRLTGSTRVVDHVTNGWHRVTVSCDGHSDSQGFWVLSERGDHDRYLSVDPGYGHRGDEVDIHVGCDWSVGRVESDALDDIDLDQDGRPWRHSGTTHVSDDAGPGEHTVRVRCGDDTMEESFFVQGDGDHEGDDGSAGGGEQVSVYPVGAPETGGGPAVEAAGGNAALWTLAAIGLTGVTGAAMIGTGPVLGRRDAGEARR